MRLSQAQIAVYARAAGLSAVQAQTASAVAMAESSGITTQHNTTGRDDSYGLWQINMTDEAGGPGRRRALGLRSDSDLYDPTTNARAMAMISNGGTNWSPWTTYTHGDYQKYMSGNATQVDDPCSLLKGPAKAYCEAGNGGLDPNDPAAGGSNLGGLTAIGELLTGAAKWMADPHSWARVAYVVLGGVLVSAGLVVASRGAWQPLVPAAKTTAAAVRKVTR